MGVGGLRSSISLSLLVHAFLVFACAFFFTQKSVGPSSARKLTWIEVDPRLAEKEKQKPKAEAERPDQRIVQTAIEEKSKTAAPDAFLGAQNQVIDRQTVSKERVAVTGGAQRAPLTKSAKESVKGQAALSKLGLAIIPKGKAEATPQDDTHRWAELGSLAQDYVKGFREAEKTALNTKEYVFFGYFQRIRQRLDLAWTPILRERLYKFYRAGRHLASDMDHTTRVMVHLNGAGEVVKVQVLQESGTRDLDDAAVRAFNQAGPFPNPPRGILDSDGTIRIRWEFVLKT